MWNEISLVQRKTTGLKSNYTMATITWYRELRVEHIVSRFETEQEAMAIANSTNVGLAGK